MSVGTPARPAIPVARPFVGTEEETAVLQVLRSGWLSQGQHVAEFEGRFAEYVGAKHAIALSSCTAALHLALLAAGISKGDEVLCPSLSFIATANAIRYVGAKPIFVDIDPATYNLDPNRIEDAITTRTRAILLVHQIGLPAALTEILEIAHRQNLMVIEDAACASGSTYHGRRIGWPHAQFACFSFHPRKILTTGEGGMITTGDDQASTRIRRLRQHAMTTSDLARHSAQRVMLESYEEVGYNYRMTDLQAAVGLIQLRRLDDFLARRRFLAQRYSSALAKLGWLVLPQEPDGLGHNYQSYMLRLTPDAPIARDVLMQGLLDRGISTRRGIMAIHREPPYRDSRWDRALPHTDAVTNDSVILPLFHQMTEQEQDQVVQAIKELGAISRT